MNQIHDSKNGRSGMSLLLHSVLDIAGTEPLKVMNPLATMLEL